MKKSILKYNISIKLFASSVILLFFIVSFPNNRVEADDAFWYAQIVRDGTIDGFFNPRFMLYLPFCKLLYSTITLIFPAVDAYLFMCVLSMFFSVLVILLVYKISTSLFKFNKNAGIFLGLLVLFSYQYWRYSMEAELYILSLFFLLLALREFLNYDRSARRLGQIILISALAVLFYKPNFIPIFLCFPLVFVLRRWWKDAVIFYAGTGTLVLLSIVLIYTLANYIEAPFLYYLTGGVPAPTGNPLMSVFVVASNIVSTLWVYSVAEIVDFVELKLVDKVLVEELYLNNQVTWELMFLYITTFVIAAAVVYLVVASVKHKVRTKSHEISEPVIILMAWVGAYALFLLVMDPTSNEPWFMVQIPLLWLFVVLVNSAKFLSKTPVSLLLIVVLVVHNYVGGINLLKDVKYDYNTMKSRWLVENASGEDVIISLGPTAFIRYLRYHTEARVINLEENYETTISEIPGLLNGYSKVYLTEDVITPPKAIVMRSGYQQQEFQDVLHDFRLEIRQISSNLEFKTYEIIVVN